MNLNKLLIVIFMMAVLLFGLNVGKALAVEGGLGHYPSGAQDFMMGAAPPPGFYFENLFLYYNITDYRDIRGAGGVPIKDMGIGKPDVKGYAFIDALRLIYVTKTKVLGANAFFHILQPFAYLHLEAQVPGMELGTDTKSGLGDTDVAAGLAWHINKNLHVMAGLDLFLPTGAYDRDDMANPLANNFYTFMPMAMISYITDGGWEASTMLMYNINTTNTQTGYSSGQEFHADYVLGKHCGKWAYGINGYYYYQTTKDDMRGQDPTFDGNKGRIFAFGPAVEYNYKNMFFKFKYQYETAVTNKPEGQRWWFNYIYAF
jgi:hypothetical protein